jgi:hypothetical protein
MNQLAPFERFWQAGPPKRDPLDHLAMIIVLMIVWRLVGGC